jgi:hypothetical protein
MTARVGLAFDRCMFHAKATLEYALQLEPGPDRDCSVKAAQGTIRELAWMKKQATKRERAV